MTVNVYLQVNALHGRKIISKIHPKKITAQPTQAYLSMK